MSSQSQSVDYIFKVILIGGQSVGKSAILNRFVDNHFSDNYVSTIGVDFKIKTIIIEKKVVKLQIWDTAGQERFGALTSSHYKGAHGCICVFDITSEKSFKEAQRYLEQAIDQYNIPGQQIYLVGNKQDLEESREVQTQQALEFSQKYNSYYCESSAKNNLNILQVFEIMTQNLVNNVAKTSSVSREQQSQGQQIKKKYEVDQDLGKKTGCC